MLVATTDDQNYIARSLTNCTSVGNTLLILFEKDTKSESLC